MVKSGNGYRRPSKPRITDRATPTNCPECRRPTWSLIVDVFTVHLDTTRLDIAAEILTIAAGGKTYRLGKAGSSWWAVRRTITDIRYHAGRDPVVLRAHNCNTATGTDHPHYWPQPPKPEPIEGLPF